MNQWKCDIFHIFHIFLHGKWQKHNFPTHSFLKSLFCGGTKYFKLLSSREPNTYPPLHRISPKKTAKHILLNLLTCSNKTVKMPISFSLWTVLLAIFRVELIETSLIFSKIQAIFNEEICSVVQVCKFTHIFSNIPQIYWISSEFANRDKSNLMHAQNVNWTSLWMQQHLGNDKLSNWRNSLCRLGFFLLLLSFSLSHSFSLGKVFSKLFLSCRCYK